MRVELCDLYVSDLRISVVFLLGSSGKQLSLGAITMDPLSELQDDLTLEDTNQSLSQLKLASLDDKNWPADEVPVFPKSGGHPCWGQQTFGCRADFEAKRYSRTPCALACCREL